MEMPRGDLQRKVRISVSWAGSDTVPNWKKPAIVPEMICRFVELIAGLLHEHGLHVVTLDC